MGKLSAKLHSTRGASLVIALIFMLVCLLLGVVCLGAASANAGRLTHLREDQASYLAVRSAAELLRDDIRGVEYGVITTNGTAEYKPAPADFETKLYCNLLLAELVKAAYEKDPAESERITTLEIGLGESKVTAELKMYNHDRENRYSISAELYIAGEAASGDSPKESYMRLYIPASLTERRDVSRTGGTDTTVVTTAIVWGEGAITKAEAAGSGVTP